MQHHKPRHTFLTRPTQAPRLVRRSLFALPALCRAPTCATRRSRWASTAPTPYRRLTDAFTFRASNGQGNSNIATVTITIGGSNRAPSGLTDTATADEDTPVDVPTLANDTDPDGDSLRATPRCTR